MNTTELQQVYKIIKPYIHKTPVLTSRLLNAESNATVFLKCENFQKTGSYKLRGATHAILNLSELDRNKGVVTHSSGNFAQALSCAAKNLKVKAHIVMPSSVPNAKKNAVKEYNGTITVCEPNLKTREAESAKIQQKTGATFIHPSNDLQVILGQGTASYELIQEQSNLDYIICPVGGGGLIAGTSLFTHHFSPKTKVIGAEPLKVDDAYRSLLSGKIETNEISDTIADGLKTNLGSNNFPIIQKYVDRIIRVEEQEIVDAMRFVWERMKIVIEPSSAVAIAALLKEPQTFENKKVGIIISGGNVDLGQLPF